MRGAFRQLGANRSLFILIVLWAVVRLLCVPLLSVWHQGGDADFYLATAQSIAQTGGYSLDGIPTALRVPGYSAFIATASLFRDPAIPNVIVAQCLITLGVALYAHRFSRWWGYAIAASPFGAFMDFKLLSESLYTSLLVLSFTVVVFSKLNRWRAALAGLLFAALVLTRETFLFFPFALLALLLWYQRIKPRHVATCLAVFLFSLSIWSARDHITSGTYALSEGEFGVNLWIGTWEHNDRWMVGAVHLPDARMITAYTDTMAGRPHDELFRRLAVEQIEHHPERVLATWIIRAPHMWIGTRTEILQLKLRPWSPAWTLFKSTAWGLNVLVLLLAAVGFVVQWRQERWLALTMALPAIYLTLIMLPFHNSEPRYSLAALPFLYWLVLRSIGAAIASKTRLALPLAVR